MNNSLLGQLIAGMGGWDFALTWVQGDSYSRVTSIAINYASLRRFSGVTIRLRYLP